MAPKKKNPLLASIDPSSRGYGDFLEALADPSQDVSSISDAPAPQIPPPDEDGDLASVAPSPRKPAAAPAPQTAGEPSGASDIVKDYIAKKYGFQGDLSDDALKGAQALGNESRFNANIGQAAATIGNAIGTPLKAVDTSFYDKLSKQADIPEQNILERRKAAKDNLAYGDAQASLDPNSPASVASRKLYGNVLKMAGVDNPEELAGMSAKDIKDFIDRPAEGIAKLKQSRDMKEMSLAQSRANREAMMGFHDTQLGRKQGFQADQKATTALRNDSMLKQLSANYNNLKNALANNEATGTVPPQALEDLQAIVISSQGVKGAGGVTERQARKMHSLGIKASDIEQFVRGKPGDLGKDNGIVKYFKELAQFEMANIKEQAAQRAKTLRNTTADGVMTDTMGQFSDEPAGALKSPAAAANRPPPGSIVKDKTTGKHYRVGADGDTLDPIQ